ncbi:MAG TPA: FMN-dependent NADH-azoreductase [Pseudomonadales bacterium]|nr:FMN-dependent NADH-azoreductase [Pseudomonadales bacterium]
MTVLQLNTSIFGDGGQSSRLADDFVSRLRQRRGDVRVIRRDFAENPVPHLTAERFQAALTPLPQRTPEQGLDAAIADKLVAELQAADTVVIGLPMYNFGVPSSLKAWFDHVARAGATFKYTESGSVGLLAGKKVYVLATRGGIYAGTDADRQTPYVRQILSFLGMDDVEFIYAEGLAIGEESRAQSLEAANAKVESLAA